MIKKVVLGIIGLLVLVVAAAGIAYALGILKPPELESIKLYWGQVTSSNTTIKAEINVNNRLPFGIGAGSVGIYVPIYFYEVEAADLDIPSLSLPKGQSTLNASATIVQANLPQWWPDFVQQGEKLSINIKPVVKAKILGIALSTGLPNISTQVSIPIMSNMKSTEPITMGFDNASILEIAKDPNAHFVVSPPTPARPILTMESWELHWGNVTQQQTQILGTVILRNELHVPIPIQGLRVGFDMNKIAVIPDVDITPSRSELPPGESVPLAIEANIDNNKLVQWWTSHFQNGEKTAVTARLSLTVVLPVTSGLGLTQAVQLPLQPVPLFECDIQTYVMDVANYQIAKMLGKPVGEEPKSYDVKYNVQTAKLASTGPLSTFPPTPTMPTPVVPTPTPAPTLPPTEIPMPTPTPTGTTPSPPTLPQSPTLPVPPTPP
jgi:LEA14-like dessication related protein